MPLMRWKSPLEPAHSSARKHDGARKFSILGVFVALATGLALATLSVNEDVQENMARQQRAHWAAMEAERQLLHFRTLYLEQENKGIHETSAALEGQFNLFVKQLELFRQTGASGLLAAHPGAASHLRKIEEQIPQVRHALAKHDHDALDSLIEGWTVTLSGLTALAIEQSRDDASSLSSQTGFYMLLALVAIAGFCGLALSYFLLGEAEKADRLSQEAREAREKAQQALRQLADALESTGEGFLFLDSGRRVILANNRLRGFYNTIADELRPGAEFSSLLNKAFRRKQFATGALSHPPQEMALHRMASMLAPQGPVEQRLSDGRILMVTDRLTPDGGIVSVFTDVTEMKEAQALLSRRLAAIEATRDGVGIVNRDHRLVYMNRALAALHGIDAPEDYIGKTVFTLYSPKGQEDLQQHVLPVVREKGSWQGESKILRADGSTLDVELSLTLLDDGGMVGTARDISDRRKAEKEKQSLQEQFYQAQKMEAIGRLAGGIAHDFNNILASVLGYADFLAEDLPEGSEQQGFARQIQKAGQRARTLIDQILTFSRKTDPAMSVIGLAPQVSEAADMFSSALRASVDFVCEIEAPGATIRANPGQLNQMLMNLLVNAGDAVADTKGRIVLTLAAHDSFPSERKGFLPVKTGTAQETAIRFTRVTPQHTVMTTGAIPTGAPCVMIRVSDNGTGISYDVMQKMFEPFFTTKSSGKGTGLGLPTVLSIIAASGGLLLVESETGKGTSFEMYFPAAAENSHAAEKDLPLRAATEKKPGGHEALLVIDDDRQVGAMLARTLERLGYEVISCESAVEALEILRDSPGLVRLVISDYKMPKMTGLELAEILATEQPRLPVILISGYREEILRDRVRAANVRETLRKPVDNIRLSRLVRALLDEKPEEEPAQESVTAISARGVPG